MIRTAVALILSLSLVIFNCRAAAEDHLLPEQSMFTNIYFEKSFSLLSKRLGRMSGRYAFAHAVVIPAFSREYVIAFEKEDSKYTLVCIRTKISLYAYQHLEEIKNDTLTFRDLEEQKQTIAELEATLPDDIMDVEAEVVEITLDETLGRKLHKAWGAMLYKTRYPEPESLEPGSHATFGPGFDGVYYHFSFFHGVEPLSGWVWDYKRDGLVGKLVAITEAAKESCDSEDKDTRAFAEKVRDLSVALR